MIKAAGQDETRHLYTFDDRLSGNTIPLAAVSAYSFSRFSAFRTATDEIIHTDQRFKELIQGVAEAVLSQTGFDRKYVLTGDREYFLQFERMEKEINTGLDEAMTIAGSDQKKDLITVVRDAYTAYKDIFYQEASYVENNEPYLPEVLKDEKEALTDGILLKLRELKLSAERETYGKVENLGQSVSEARRIVIAIVAACALLGIIISVLVTRSIAIPLSIMRRKTRRIARGDFDCDRNFRPMKSGSWRAILLRCAANCRRRIKWSDFFSLMAHELRTPLASIREGTNLLLNNQGSDFSHNRTGFYGSSRKGQPSDGPGYSL